MRIFGAKRNEVKGDLRKLHNEELHNLYSSSNIIRRMKEDEKGKECSMNGEKKTAYGILVGKPEGKRPLGRQRGRGLTILKKILERKDGMVWT
jgi:hypothetical protein